MKWVLATLALASAALAAAPCSAEPADSPRAYAQAAGKKALAVTGSSYFIGHSHATDSAAAQDALRRCNAFLNQQADAAACEIRRLNDELISTAAEIRARLPRGARPLVMWAFQHEGATAYLVGSVHVLKATLYPLPAQIESAFQRADTLVVEVDTVNVDPGALQRASARHARLDNGASLDSVLPAATMASLQAFLAAEAIPYPVIARYRPAVLATQLALIRLTSLGYLPDFGMERHFIGRAGTRRIVELETVEQQLRLLNGAPQQVQITMLDETLDQMAELETMISDMLVAWLGGDLNAFVELFEAQAGQSEAYQAFMDEILGKRNIGMAARIGELLKSGAGSYFVLVGSAHLAGPDSIVNLLEQAGFRGRQILSNDAGLAASTQPIQH